LGMMRPSSFLLNQKPNVHKKTQQKTSKIVNIFSYIMPTFPSLFFTPVPVLTIGGHRHRP
jgi:hypothetical protein